MEDSHSFMDPKSENRQFGITVELVENVNALNDLTDISHVENIVWLGRGGQEVISNWVIQTDRSHSQSLSDLLYVIIEILCKELVWKNVMENSSHLRFWGECEVYHEEFCLDSSWNFITTSSWWTHGWDELYILNFLEYFILHSVKPSSIVHPLSQQLQWRLRAISVLLWHVKIIHVNDHLLSIWNHLCFGSSGHFALNHFLSFSTWGLWWENNACGFPRVFIQLWQDLIDQHCFTCTCHTDTQCMELVVNTILQNVLSSLWVNGWHDKTVIRSCWWGLPNDAVDLFLPPLPFVLVGVDVIVKDCVVSREHWLNVSDYKIKGLSTSFIKSSSKRPNHAECEPFLQGTPVSLALVLKVEISSFCVPKNESIEQFGKCDHDADLQTWDMLLELIFHMMLFDKELGEPLLDKFIKELLHLFVFLLWDPGFYEGSPAEVINVDKDHSCSTDSGGWGNSKILNFKDEANLRR